MKQWKMVASVLDGTDTDTRGFIEKELKSKPDKMGICEILVSLNYRKKITEKEHSAMIISLRQTYGKDKTLIQYFWPIEDRQSRIAACLFLQGNKK